MSTNNGETQEIKGLEGLVREAATDLRELLKDPTLPKEKREWIVSRLSYLEQTKRIELEQHCAVNGTPAATAKKEA